MAVLYPEGDGAKSLSCINNFGELLMNHPLAQTQCPIVNSFPKRPKNACLRTAKGPWNDTLLTNYTGKKRTPPVFCTHGVPIARWLKHIG